MALACRSRAVRTQQHHRGGARRIRVPRWRGNSLPCRRWSRAHVSCPLHRLRFAAAKKPCAAWSSVGPGDDPAALDRFLPCLRLGPLRSTGPSRHKTRNFSDDLPSGVRAWVGNRAEYSVEALSRLRSYPGRRSRRIGQNIFCRELRHRDHAGTIRSGSALALPAEWPRSRFATPHPPARTQPQGLRPLPCYDSNSIRVHIR